MRAFGPDHGQLTLADVARRTGLRATTRRVLLTLVELGYVNDDGRSYSLRPRVQLVAHSPGPSPGCA